MKLNNKILALLLVFIAIVSISAVSAADVNDNATAIGESADADDTLSTVYDIPADATVSDIEAIINSSSAGDTISFAPGATYDFGNLTSGIKIDHTLIIQGNDATIKGYQGFAIAPGDESVSGTQVYGLNFEMTDPILWNGRALEFKQGGDYIIENCTFRNGNSGIYIQRASGNVTIRNNYFFADEGATNQSTIKKDWSKQEQGAKAINLMGGKGITIIDNVFEGDYLDAVSIASSASDVEVINNDINGVWYGIYYGGGVKNITTQNNVFNGSKAFALGIIKGAGTSDISGNTFITPAGETAIYVQEGNTAHGAPSQIDTILIYENEFLGEDTVAVAASSQGGFITPKGDFIVADNVYDPSITVFEFNDNNTYTLNVNELVVPENNVTIKSNYPILLTNIVLPEGITEYTFGNAYDILLIGEDNVALGNKDFNIVISSGDVIVDEINATTDEYGRYELYLFYDVGEYNVSVSYDGGLFYSAFYDADEADGFFAITQLPAIIVGKDITLPSSIGYKYEITLKDVDNKLLTNRTVQITINGVTYNKTTDENGIAGLNIRLNMGDYNVTTTYTDGNETYSITNTLTVIQANTTIKSTPTTYTYGAQGNEFVAQLVDQAGQPISAANGGVICFHINGREYYKATDDEGKASINIRLGPGIYNMYMSFDGTFKYAASNGGSQVTVQ